VLDVAAGTEVEGFFTGYYETEFDGSRVQIFRLVKSWALVAASACVKWTT
jgi:hypothetical protein